MSNSGESNFGKADWMRLGRIETLCEQNQTALTALTTEMRETCVALRAGHEAQAVEIRQHAEILNDLRLHPPQLKEACEVIENARADALQAVTTQQDILRMRLRWVAALVVGAAGLGGVGGGALKDTVIGILKEVFQ